MRRKHRAGSDDTALLSKSWIAGLPGLCRLCKWESSRQDVKHWKVLLWHQEHDRLWRHCVIRSVDHCSQRRMQTTTRELHISGPSTCYTTKIPRKDLKREREKK